MKELKLPVESDLSDAAIEDAIIAIRNETKFDPVLLELTVSVFEANVAVHMMIDNPRIRNIRVTKEFQQGRYCLVDDIGDVMVTSNGA